MLEVRGLKVAYGGINAVKGIDLDVHTGELVTLIGANGAGKTTTLKALSGLIKPAAGSVRYDGQDVTGAPAFELVRRGLALVPEGRGVFARLSVEENLAMGAYIRNGRDSKSAIAADCDHAYATFPRLAERRKQLAGTLSGGEQQMLAISRALMTQPKLLMLDEPSLGLAPIVVDEIFEIIRRINREEKMSVLLVEQNAIAALDVVSHGYLIENGHVVMHDSADVMKRNPDIQEFYLGGREGRDFRDVKHYRRRKRWL